MWKGRARTGVGSDVYLARTLFVVIPAKAGIHLLFKAKMDSGFRRNDESGIVTR
jgi:hypothetical protein